MWHVYCPKLRKHKFISGSCCSSCLEDDRLGYCGLPEVSSPDREILLHVCCRHLESVRNFTAERWAALKNLPDHPVNEEEKENA